MFRYSLFLDTLLKAMTHKYIRRIPKGVTKTGATKYMYYYAGQEGHGKGIAHDEELTAGASFAFGEHGKTRYHAHIVLEAGDRITIQYDDGDKKGQKETMSKKEFRDLLHKEHASAIQGAKEKAAKQLKDFQAGKEKGVKVKQSTLDKLEQRVKNLDALAPTAKEEIFEGVVEAGINKLENPREVAPQAPNFQGSVQAPEIRLGVLASIALKKINPSVHKQVFMQADDKKGVLHFFVEKANGSGDIVDVRSILDHTINTPFSIAVSTKELQEVLAQSLVGISPVMRFQDNALFFDTVIPLDDPSYFGRRPKDGLKKNENTFYKIPVQEWQKPEEKKDTPQQKGAIEVIDRLRPYRSLIDIANSLAYKRQGISALQIRGVDSELLFSNDGANDMLEKLVLHDKVDTKGVPNDSIINLLNALESKDYLDPNAKSKTYPSNNPYVRINKRWDTKEQARWEHVIKPALKSLGLSVPEMKVVDKYRKVPEVEYMIPLKFLNEQPGRPDEALEKLFDDTKIPEVKYAPLTDKQKDLITKYNKNDVKGFKSFIFEDDSVGEEIENEDMGSKDPDKLYIYAEGTYADREALNKLGFKFVQKKEGEKNVSYYKYKAPVSKL